VLLRGAVSITGSSEGCVNKVILNKFLVSTLRDCSNHGRPQKFFQGGNVDILPILFRLLKLQYKHTVAKRFALSTP